MLVKAEDEKDLASYYYPIKNNDAAEVKWGEQRDTHGFVSPIFLREPGLASTRWRPWEAWGGTRSAALERENATFDALLFAFLGSGEVPDNVKAVLVSAGWTDPDDDASPAGPLLGKGKTAESFMFMREPLDENDNPCWDKGNDFTTILTLRNFLAGKGKTGLQKDGGERLRKARKPATPFAR